MFAAYSILYVWTFPRNGGNSVTWEARGVRAQLGPGGKGSVPGPPPMKQEKYTFVCLAFRLLHRALKLGVGGGGQDEWGRQC